MGNEKVEEFSINGDELLAKVRQLVHEGNVRRLTIKNEKGDTLLVIPLTIGVIGAALLPVFAADILLVGPFGLGILRTAPALGALSTLLLTTRRPPSTHAGPLLLGSVAGFGVSILVFGASTDFLLSLCALFALGATDAVSMVIRTVTVRMYSPEHMRGRIASVSYLFIGASNELGAFESGLAARVFGTVPSVMLGGVLTLVVTGVVAVAAPALRRLDLREAATEAAVLEAEAARTAV